MRYGRTHAEKKALTDQGFLPIYSVEDEEIAHRLLVLACETNIDGEFVARELAEDQSLANLYAFGDRLEKLHKRLA